jgi:hypothetical protein
LNAALLENSDIIATREGVVKGTKSDLLITQTTPSTSFPMWHELELVGCVPDRDPVAGRRHTTAKRFQSPSAVKSEYVPDTQPLSTS